jgi:hypothetical protein
MKPLDIDRARDGEVMLAFRMNGEQCGWYKEVRVKDLDSHLGSRNQKPLGAPDSTIKPMGYEARPLRGR